MSRGSALGIGVVGCGLVATELHLPALRRLSDARVVAVADVDRDRLAAVGDQFHIAARADDWRAVVERPDVDIVAVCVPPAYHAEVTLGALDAGKHVLVEKPLATSLDDCDRMIERAAQAGRIVTVGFNMRCHRLVRRARAIVAGGTLGPLSLVRSVFASGARQAVRARPWRANGDPGAGVLTEIGVHHYDLWRFLLDGEVEEVIAAALPGGGAATVSARMTDGTLVAAAFSELTGGRNEIDLFGAAGQLHLSCYRFDGLEVAAVGERYPGSARTRLRRMERLMRELPEIVSSMRRGGDYVDSYRAEWSQLLAAVRSGGPTGPSLLDGRRALEVGLAAVESASTGRPVACRTGERTGEPGPGHSGTLDG